MEIMKNGLKLSRDDHVKVMQIPQKYLEEVRTMNAQKCLTAEPRLAPASTDFVYAVLTKTHFVHAWKIAENGGATLYDNGLDKLKFTGQEWRAILANYSEFLARSAMGSPAVTASVAVYSPYWLFSQT